MKDKMIIALDYPSFKEAKIILNELKGTVRFVKVGMNLFYNEGTSVIDRLKDQGLKVFLDLKLHDIPHTVTQTIKSLSTLEADFMTIHTLGGTVMMKSAVDAIKEMNKSIKLIGVTHLTSMDEKDLSKIGINDDMNTSVLHLAKLAKESGLSGVVCSAHEALLIKENIRSPFIRITPGIRLKGHAHDQIRIMTPSMAMNNGATHLVLGRVITLSENPLKTFCEIEENLYENNIGRDCFRTKDF